MLRELWFRLRALLRRDSFDRELDDELQYHLEREAEKIKRSGAELAEAERQSKIVFGSLEAVKEECREERGTALVETIAGDLRYAARGLMKHPVFTAAAVFSLAAGIGMNTAVFSLLDRAVFRPLPVERPEELVIARLASGGRAGSFSYPFFIEMERRQTALAGMFASADYGLKDLMVRGTRDPEAASCRMVTGAYFRVLGVQPEAGRMFDEKEDQPAVPGVAVISDRFWEKRFQRRLNALGEVLKINQAQVAIIGVAPREFFGEKPGSIPDLWVPMRLQPKLMPSDMLQAKFVTWLTVMGRLKEGGSKQAAASSLSALAGELGKLTIETEGEGKKSVVLEDGSRGLEELRREFSRPLWLLMAMSGLVLAISCFNLATLQLSRGGARTREFGVRLALGASRGRLMRQLMTESALLASIGALFGVGLALWASDALVRLAGDGRALSLASALDARMLGFTAATAICSTLLFGLVPAWLASSNADPAKSTGAESRTATAPRSFLRGAQALMVAQIAVSLAVVCGSVLLTRSLGRLRSQDFGIRPAGLTMVKLPLELTPGAMKRQEVIRGEVIERISALPGVVAAAASCCGPFDEIAHTSKAAAESAGQIPSSDVHIVHVSAGYIETMGMSLLRGRTFADTDTKGTPKVAVLTEYAASRLLGSETAVGKRISFGDAFDRRGAMEVVGVVKDARFSGPREEYRALILVPMAQQPSPVTTISVRTADGQDRNSEIRAILKQTAPGVALGEITSYGKVIEKMLHNERTVSLLSLLFAGQVLVLAASGLFGLIWFLASGRKRELGVRAAMGAQPVQLTRLLLRQAAMLLGVGALIGGAGAYALAQSIRSFLFGVSTQDPVSFAAAASALALTGLAAAVVPAWRAARADPLDTLRAE